MTSPACPTTEEWTRLVDGEVTANRAAELERHGAGCARCADQLRHTRRLLADAATCIPAASGAVSRVMAALDAPAPPKQGKRWRPSLAMGALAGSGLVAAAAVAAVVFTSQGKDKGEFTARGGHSATAIERKVGVELYASGTKLEAGAHVAATAALTARVRNLHTEAPVHMLLFAVDARREVHWLFPAYLDPATDPSSMVLPAARDATPLGQSVVLDAPATGAMTIVTVLSPTSLHVSYIEKATAAERRPEALQKRWPHASVQTLGVTVTR